MSDAASAGAAMPRPAARALAWLAFLGPFFYLTYGTANWLAAGRDQVPAIVFDWEHAIPFVDWTIIPYWTSNLFYALSLFLCRDRHELDTLGRRLVTAQVVAVGCFILFPLRFTFTPPATEGIPGFLFASLASFDKPFNQAPSLHITLLVIFWAFYPRRVAGSARWLLHLWFALIGISVLTTYQHHFIDIPTGILLGLLCLWLWPEERHWQHEAFAAPTDGRRARLAAIYGAGALLTAMLAVAAGGIGLWLFWPAVSLLLVAANYAFLGPDGFQKRADGTMTAAGMLLFAPYLAGAWINSRLWTRADPNPVTVAEGVSLGRMPPRGVAARFRRVVDLSAEMPRTCDHAGWHAVPMLDLAPPEPKRLARAAGAIEAARRDGPVLVCCALGFSRSAAAVATWLVRHGGAGSVEDAVAQVRRARPRIVLKPADLIAIEAAAAPAGPSSAAMREILR